MIELNPPESSLTLIDLLSSSSQPLSVININLSKPAKVGSVIFTRPLPDKQFNTFSEMYKAPIQG
jgi:hypothetical protein